jgi:hypothetical protein
MKVPNVTHKVKQVRFPGFEREKIIPCLATWFFIDRRNDRAVRGKVGGARSACVAAQFLVDLKLGLCYPVSKETGEPSLDLKETSSISQFRLTL